MKPEIRAIRPKISEAFFHFNLYSYTRIRFASRQRTHWKAVTLSTSASSYRERRTLRNGICLKLIALEISASDCFGDLGFGAGEKIKSELLGSLQHGDTDTAPGLPSLVLQRGAPVLAATLPTRERRDPRPPARLLANTPALRFVVE